MDYKIISCDDHIDLQMLPHDLWTQRLVSSMRDRAPRVEERDGRAVWLCEGKVWGPWFGQRPASGAARPPSPVINAFDRSGISEQSDRRPGVAALRLADMDRDGVQTHVMFGPVVSIIAEDPALRDDCYRAYNDWLAEFCAAAPDRLIGVAMLPESPEAALKELLRLAGRGGFARRTFRLPTSGHVCTIGPGNHFGAHSRRAGLFSPST